MLLRYLTDAYRALRQSIPEGLRTGELEDLIAWLGEITRLVDSSLLDEWNELAALAGVPVEQRAEVAPPARPVTGNERAFRVMVRNAMICNCITVLVTYQDLPDLCLPAII